MLAAVQSASTASAPWSVGRTEARGVLSTAVSPSWTGSVVTSNAIDVASGMVTPSSAAIAGTAEPVASTATSAG